MSTSNRPSSAEVDAEPKGDHAASDSRNIGEQALCFAAMFVGIVFMIGLVLAVVQHLMPTVPAAQLTFLGGASYIFKIAGRLFWSRAWPHWCATRHYPLWRRILEAFCIGLIWPCWLVPRAK